jgi:hypothetical protein
MSEDRLNSHPPFSFVRSLERFIQKKQHGTESVCPGSPYHLPNTIQLCHVLGHPGSQGICSPHGSLYLEGNQLHPTGANSATGLGKNGIDPNGSKKGALSGHVRSGNKKETPGRADLDIVSNTRTGGKEGVAQPLGLKDRLNTIPKFREGPVWVIAPEGC